MNAKRDEEFEVLPQYLDAIISSFRLIKSFLSWKEAILRLDGWNPYKVRTIAKNLAEMAKEREDNKAPNPQKGRYNYIRVATPPEAHPTTVKERLRKYKIPKKLAQSSNHAAAPAPPEHHNKKKRRRHPNPPKPFHQSSAKKRKVDRQETEEEEEEWIMEVADLARSFHGIKRVLKK